MKKALSILVLVLMLSLALPFAALADDSTTADLFRYVPTCITVTGEKAQVEGYFVNMSAKDILKITKLKLTIYKDGEELIEEGSFSGDNLENFELEAGGTKPWTFTYASGGKDLNEGTYVVDSNVYAMFSCSFKSRAH